MAPSTVNILLSSFPGLGLPSTLCVPVSSSSSITDFTSTLSDRLPTNLSHRLILTTSSNQPVVLSSTAQISTLQTSSNQNGNILSLRLSAPLCGGKGGFGSQLRAAGGRMSSRKKRAQRENNGSNRNLDGRRLRTVTEAKALAEYLAVKPEMDKKEKDERRKRWEQVVEAAEKREDEIKNGNGKARVDGKWAEAKEEAEQKTREAVMAAMRNGLLRDDVIRTKGESDVSAEGSTSGSESDVEEGSSSKATTPPDAAETRQAGPRKIFGWDEEDEDMSDDEDEDMSDDEDEDEEEA